MHTLGLFLHLSHIVVSNSIDWNLEAKLLFERYANILRVIKFDQIEVERSEKLSTHTHMQTHAHSHTPGTFTRAYTRIGSRHCSNTILSVFAKISSAAPSFSFRKFLQALLLAIPSKIIHPSFSAATICISAPSQHRNMKLSEPDSVMRPQLPFSVSNDNLQAQNRNAHEPLTSRRDKIETDLPKRVSTLVYFRPRILFRNSTFDEDESIDAQ